MIEKAAASDADAVCIDLEDAVAVDEKPASRANVVRAFKELDFGRKLKAFRINGLDTPFAYRDLIEVVEAAGDRIDVVMMPKANLPQDVRFVCMGAPAKIVQTPTELIFLYGQGNQFRVIPIDGRPHDPIKSQDTTWYGDAVGKWEGDTMVIDIVGFNDESWIEWPGWFHSNNMHVVERYTRNGNTLRWEAIVEDPDVLTEPYHVRGRTLRLNPDPKATLTEDLPCEERDSQHMVTHERG